MFICALHCFDYASTIILMKHTHNDQFEPQFNGIHEDPNKMGYRILARMIARSLLKQKPDKPGQQNVGEHKK
jgi:hypothetical protein